MKIAIISSGQPTFTKGLASYVYEKCRRMQEKQNASLQVDCFMLRDDFSPLMKRIINRRSNEKVPNWEGHEDSCYVKGVNYRCIWRNNGLIDNILYSKMGIKYKENAFRHRVAKFLKCYDVICTHKLACHLIGLYLKEKYGIPYIATWHGSDINVYPYDKEVLRKDTVLALEGASMNLFVSKGLMNASYSLTDKIKCDVIYTGAASHFRRYSDAERDLLKNKYQVNGCKVVSFIGNLVPVKNVSTIPAIFKMVAELYKGGKIVFWIIGNGELEQSLRKDFSQSNIDVRFLGRKDSADMPEYYNCLDVNVLPSQNEGFSLVNVEARTCGVNVVGSNVGGIPESIGQQENVFPLDGNFVQNISRRIVEILDNNEKPEPLPKEMSWDYAIEKELMLCRELSN